MKLIPKLRDSLSAPQFLVPNSAGCIPNLAKRALGMPNHEDEYAYGGKFRTHYHSSVFAARIWSNESTEVRDRESMKWIASLDRANRRRRLTPAPELREVQRVHHRLHDFQDDLVTRPDQKERWLAYFFDKKGRLHTYELIL